MSFWDKDINDQGCGCGRAFSFALKYIVAASRNKVGPCQNLSQSEIEYFARSQRTLAQSSVIKHGYRASVGNLAGNYCQKLQGLVEFPQAFSRPGLGVVFAAAAVAAHLVARGKWRKDERDITPQLLEILHRTLGSLERRVQRCCPVPMGGGARAIYLPTTSHEKKVGADFALFTHITRPDGSQAIRPILVQAKVSGRDHGRHEANIYANNAQPQAGRMATKKVRAAYLFYHHDNPPILTASAMPARIAVDQADQNSGIVNTIGPGSYDFPVFLMQCFDPANPTLGEFDRADDAIQSILDRDDYDKEQLAAFGVTTTGGSLFEELARAIPVHLAPRSGQPVIVTPQVPEFDHNWKPDDSWAERKLPIDDWFPPEPPEPDASKPRGPRQR